MANRLASVILFLTLSASKLGVALCCLELCYILETQNFLLHNSQPLLRINSLATLEGFVVTLTKHTNWFSFLLIIATMKCVLYVWMEGTSGRRGVVKVCGFPCTLKDLYFL